MTKHWFLTLFCHETGSSSSKFNTKRCNLKEFSRRFRFLRSQWWVLWSKSRFISKILILWSVRFFKNRFFDETSISRDGIWIAGRPCSRQDPPGLRKNRKTRKSADMLACEAGWRRGFIFVRVGRVVRVSQTPLLSSQKRPGGWSWGPGHFPLELSILSYP